ncbi:MAG: DNA cytosine methyltransferase [Gaiellaceae bacterium]
MSALETWELAARFAESLPPGGLQELGWTQRRDGLVLPPGVEPTKAERPLGIGLFAGAGGFDLGMVTAGFHVIGASEWWPIAVETYLCNLGSPDTVVYVGETAAPDATKKERALFERHGGTFVPAGELFTASKLGAKTLGPGSGWISQACDHDVSECRGGGDDAESKQWFHESYCGGDRDDGALPCELFWMCDVRELTGALILDQLGLTSDDVSVVFGGPPCQGFSHANANRGAGDSRNQLVFEFARLVCEIKPKAMVMENVPGIVSMLTPEGIPVVDALTRILEDGGMGEYDALRKSLLATSGAGAVVKGAKSGPKRSKGATADEDVDGDEIGDEQLELAVPA